MRAPDTGASQEEDMDALTLLLLLLGVGSSDPSSDPGRGGTPIGG